MGADLDSVLLGVELTVSAAARALDPVRVVSVPLNRFLQTTLPRFARTPAELSLNAGWIDCVAVIVARTILDEFDQRMRFSELIENRSGHVDIASLIPG